MHSQGGMNFDNILLNEFGEITGCMNYQAVSNPLDENSSPVKVQLARLTGKMLSGILRKKGTLTKLCLPIYHFPCLCQTQKYAFLQPKLTK